MNSFDCIVIGEVLIDIIIRTKEDYTKLCHGGISYCTSIKTVFGGGGNVATGLSAIGGTSAFVGKAGQDFFGKLYADNLKKNGVFTQMFHDKTLNTGLAVVFVDKEQRSFLVFRGANDQLLFEEIEKTSDLIKQSNYLYFSGFSLINEPQKNTILKAIELAKMLGKKIMFDPGAFNLIKLEKNLFDSLLDTIDIFSPNLDEARAITKVFSIKDIIEKLRKRIPITFLKCDKNGSIIITKDDVIEIPNYRTNCVDPNGAGDAFNSGALYGLSHGLTLESTGRLANWFSAKVVSKIGPRSFPKKSEILQFLKEIE